MKTLKTIQTLSKIGKILSKIVFICCIVGFCACIAGAVGIAVGGRTLKLGGVTINSFIMSEAGIGTGAVYSAIVSGAILCAGEGVLAKFAEHYFGRELSDGTPFNIAGAKELLRLGILTICIPLGTRIIAEIIVAMFSEFMAGAEPISFDNGGSVALGVMFIIMSLVCRYGAELRAEEL